MNGRFDARFVTEEAHLSTVHSLEMPRADRQQLVQHCQQGIPLTESIQSSHLDQAFQGTLPHLAQIHSPGEISEVFEGTILAFFRD